MRRRDLVAGTLGILGLAAAATVAALASDHPSAGGIGCPLIMSTTEGLTAECRDARDLRGAVVFGLFSAAQSLLLAAGLSAVTGPPRARLRGWVGPACFFALLGAIVFLMIPGAVANARASESGNSNALVWFLGAVAMPALLMSTVVAFGRQRSGGRAAPTGPGMVTG